MGQRTLGRVRRSSAWLVPPNQRTTTPRVPQKFGHLYQTVVVRRQSSRRVLTKASKRRLIMLNPPKIFKRWRGNCRATAVMMMRNSAVNTDNRNYTKYRSVLRCEFLLGRQMFGDRGEELCCLIKCSLTYTSSWKLGLFRKHQWRDNFMRFVIHGICSMIV